MHYQDKVYPTAYHLYESLKFMPHRPDIVENIRACPGDVHGVNRAGDVARQYASVRREDWAEIMVHMVCRSLSSASTYSFLTLSV